ncbi:MAG: hypothetical protein KAU47_05905, partial [Candidatus Aminicenantes bacterium]|nr:hypothetical protein [Candidatus Aminicenantes bacterium]
AFLSFPIQGSPGPRGFGFFSIRTHLIIFFLSRQALKIPVTSPIQTKEKEGLLPAIKIPLQLYKKLASIIHFAL